METRFGHTIFHPWVGVFYEKLPLKIMILGESHYGTEGANFLHNKTSRELRTGFKKAGFWRKLEALIPSGFDAGDQGRLDSIVFYNYVQELVGAGARVRPRDEAWTSEASINGFLEVLDQCQPDRVLVIGKTLWSRLPGSELLKDRAPHPVKSFPLPVSFTRGLDQVDRFAFHYPRAGGAAICAPIFHPAFPKGFHSEDTKNVAQKLFSF